MKMGRDETIVFIISHGRAGNVKTLSALRRAGYTGKVVIVIDDEDKAGEEYIRIYGQSNVLVFSKEEWKEKTDTVTNEKDYNTPVYARNFVSWYATENKHKFYVMLDDDISSFCVRYVKGGKLKSSRLLNADKYFSLIVGFMKENKHILCVGTGNAGSYIGGAEGKFSKGLHIGDFSQSIVCRGRIEFKGVFNEDENMSVIEGMAGNLCVSELHVSHTSPKRKSNKGGLKEEYDCTNDYFINMFSVVCCPSCCGIVLGKNGIQLRVDRGSQFPKIVSERYKKR